MPHKQTIMEILKEVYETRMPFNILLGVKVESIDLDHVCVRIDMKDDLVGNFNKEILHGGVISSCLDLTGGIIAAAGVIKQMDGRSLEDIAKRLLGMSTIDLRVDFLRHGKGRYFLTTGAVLRTGNKVAVVRVQMHNDEGALIADGTAAYIVG